MGVAFASETCPLRNATITRNAKVHDSDRQYRRGGIFAGWGDASPGDTIYILNFIFINNIQNIWYNSKITMEFSSRERPVSGKPAVERQLSVCRLCSNTGHPSKLLRYLPLNSKNTRKSPFPGAACTETLQHKLPFMLCISTHTFGQKQSSRAAARRLLFTARSSRSRRREYGDQTRPRRHTCQRGTNPIMYYLSC